MKQKVIDKAAKDYAKNIMKRYIKAKITYDPSYYCLESISGDFREGAEFVNKHWEEKIATKESNLPASILLTTKLKALMIGLHFVDTNLLCRGVYTSEKPTLYEEAETIDTLIDRANMLRDAHGANFVPDSYLENLKKCELVSVTIIIG